VRHEYRSSRLRKPLKDATGQPSLPPAAADIRTDLIDAERRYIFQLLREGRITDESRRRIERELDLEEASVVCWKERGIEPPL
jgi:CPA1 family monovalent cation:H+ antiporter